MEEEYKGYTIRMIQDEDPQDPREAFSPMGKMLCIHSRYNLGDEHNFDVQFLRNFVARGDVVSLPLYLYDHSGLSMSTGSFVGRAPHAGWDSGQVGYITITKGKIREEYNVKRISKKILIKVLKYLRGEVEEYDHYLTGNVWGFEIEDPEGDMVDSCWGFYGDPEDYMLKECKSIVDHFVTEAGKREEKMILAGII